MPATIIIKQFADRLHAFLVDHDEDLNPAAHLELSIELEALDAAWARG